MTKYRHKEGDDEWDRGAQMISDEIFLFNARGRKVEALDVRRTSMLVLLDNGWCLGARIEDGCIAPISCSLDMAKERGWLSVPEAVKAGSGQ